MLLAAATLALYWPVRQFDLVYWDDPLLLTGSPEVQAGLTWPSMKWALTSVVIANWQPVTNLSFLVVSQFFGIAPGAHHLANAVIHAANAALLFLLLRQLTKSTWRSAAVAAIFAWHPLRVESVAWIAERKDVLCAFFFLLSLLCYARGATSDGCRVTTERAPTPPVARHSSLYWLAVIFFALALLSKPMAVTLPWVLLLLDFWPLARIPETASGTQPMNRSAVFMPLQRRLLGRHGSGLNAARLGRFLGGRANGQWPMANLRRLLVEKIPFFALMILFCVATYWIQRDYAAMTPWEKLGLAPRVANAISSDLAYLAQLFWPLHLAAIYPFPQSIDWTETALKAALLLAISAGCLVQLTRRPWLAVGWFWYLGTALPIIGIVQVGEQAMADRYTYLPLIGPAVALVWTAAEIFPRRRGGKIFLAATTISILFVLAALSERQLQFWRDTISLFSHNLDVTPGNGSAEFTLGLGYQHAGDRKRAITCFRAAKAMSPGDLQVRQSLGDMLRDEGDLAAATAEYAALVELEPTYINAHVCLAAALAAQGQEAESIAQLNEALRLDPNLVEALNNLAWELATSPRAELRDGPRAVALAQRACELTHFQKTLFVGTLAAAQAEAGKFDNATASAERACDLAAKNGETNLLRKNQELLARYRAHKKANDE